MSEIPDDVFVTQYTQFNSLRDVVCRYQNYLQLVLLERLGPAAASNNAG